MHCVTCRTGLNTTMGKMIRELLAPSTQPAKQDPFVAVRIFQLLHVMAQDICVTILHRQYWTGLMKQT